MQHFSNTIPVFAASSPSNIALVKYWGKKPGDQIPANPSVSVTLENARTYIRMNISENNEANNENIKLLFHGKEMPAFLPKIKKFFSFVEREVPFLNDYNFLIESANTFPHSAGIASSASSMSAMAMCLVDFEQWVTKKELSESEYRQRVSYFSRLGSGSACRSLYAGVASWGEASADQTSDLWATPMPYHESFEGLHDTIVIVDAKQKSVSSRAGHGLMKSHPFAEARFIQAKQNWDYAIQFLAEGRWDELGAIIEEEALALHAMMMTSRPGYLLMAPDTIKAINLLREFRYETGVPLYFTLDAGPNLHLLYPQSARDKCFDFIQNILVPALEGARFIDDVMGSGARREDPENPIPTRTEDKI